MKKLLCGPVEIPQFVLDAMDTPSISHRSPEYEKIQKEVEMGMQEVFGTLQPVLTVTSSGTGCMEAAIINCFSPGDHVVIPIVGNFSKQFSSMASEYGLDVEEVPFEYGQSADPVRVGPHLKPDTKGLFVVHNESSSGVTNDLKGFGALVRDHKAILVVDSVSGAAGLPLEMDGWGIDILITSSQKCLMAPAGLAFMALSEKAWQRCERSGFPRYYFDLRRFRKFNQDNQTPTTPGIYNLMAVASALQFIRKNGVGDVVNRTAENAALLRSGLKEIGLELVAKEDAIPSDTLTTVLVPGKSAEWLSALKEKGFQVAGGLAPYKEDTFRIGTMGYVFREDIEGMLSAAREIQNERL